MAKKVRKVSTPRGEGRSMVPLSPYQITVSYNNASAGIVQNNPSDWFGPLNPMKPVAPPEVAGRRYDFPPGFNVNVQPRGYDIVGFPMMRSLADSYDLLRLVIETRKDQLSRLRWTFRPSDKDARGKPKPPKPGQQKKIDELKAFFARPDGVNRWRPWLRSALEDVFVIDALSLYCQRNRGGKLIALQQVDGATIKVVLDNWGRTPQPYTNGGQLIVPPAYQQFLKGYPAVDYSTRDILYRPLNRRVHKAYGYSPVEQIIITVNIAMRRQMFQLAYYTEGNVPEALIGTPDSWTPEQILAFQTNWDAINSGNLSQRRHAKFVPGGVAKTYIPTKEPDLKNPMDDWLARILCFAFSTSPQQLVTMMNRATAKTSGDQSKEEGIEPLKEYVAELVTDIAEQEFGVEIGDIEFAFEEETEVDQEKQTTILTKRVEDGAITLNEMREELGQEESDNPAADMLMVKTGTGYIPIEANTMEAKQAEIDAGLRPDPLAPPPAPGGGFGGDPKPEPGKPAPKGKPAKPAPKATKEHAAHAIRTVRFAKAARRARRLAPVPFDLPKSLKAERKAKKLIAGALKKTAKRVAAQFRSDFGKSLSKAGPRERAGDFAADADLSAIEEIVAGLGDILSEATQDVVTRALAQVGPDAEAGLVDQVNEEAVAIAFEQAAEMVGMRYNSAGDLVPSRNAETRIDESTREAIQDIIADGLDENIGNDAIADNIMEATAFSEDRAQLIAHTEIRNANSRAAVAGYTGARDELGINVQKEWLLGENPCEICEENADDGPIDLDDEFSSGDTEPTAHPNCECAVAPVVVDNPDEGGDTSDEEADDVE